MRFAVSSLLCVLVLAGCASHHKKSVQADKSASSATKSQLIVTPENRLVGRVVKVNDSGRFVIVNFPIGRMPEQGTVFSTYRNGLKVGGIKISGPQQNDNTVADILMGEAAAGDEVRHD